MGIIKASKLVFDYLKYNDEGKVEETSRAIDQVDLDVEAGQFIAVLGHNGSGKSTLAKHINGLLIPTEGTVWVDHMNTENEEELWKIRQKAGMVFQNPDNQIIGTVVEEDVGFGPENMGVPTEDIWRRVDESLNAVGMTAYRHHSPNKLSGGQKQRVAIAGVVAMRPKCIVLDEKVYSNAELDTPLAPSDTVKNLIDFLDRNRKEWGLARNVFLDSADQATMQEWNKYKRRNGCIYTLNDAWKQMEIIDRINAQLGWMAFDDATGIEPNFYVLDTCPTYISELETYSWKEDKDNTPEDGHDHMVNSVQYGWIPYQSKIYKR